MHAHILGVVGMLVGVLWRCGNADPFHPMHFNHWIAVGNHELLITQL